MKSTNFCAALGCTHLMAASHTPFCMRHWVKLSRVAQRAVRERTPDAVERAKDELIRGPA